jgi:16S rRNA (cytosine967-C5)-methyltransferase
MGGEPPAPSPAPAGVAARTAAWRVLRLVHADGAWSTTAVDRVLRRSRLDARDRAFAANLAYEALRWEGTLDWALDRVLKRPVDQTEPAVLDALRLGAWQLLFGASPDRAVVSTSVDLVRAEVGQWATGFVNGALRALARQASAGIRWPDEATDEGLGIRLGYAAWIVTEARRRFGGRARAVLEAGNDAPGVTLRAVGDRDALVAELGALGLTAEPGRHAPEAVRAPGADPGRLAAVAEGRAAVQDEASMLVARAVAAAGPAAVLDACAGPGGKTAHLAQLGARVFAADLRPARARLVAETAARLGVAERVHVVAADATRPPWRDGRFDAVLVDAPCTGLGIVRRRPEIRWRRDPSDVPRLAALQLEILEGVVELVRPDGLLLYSACTWTLAETDDVVRAFVAVNGDRVAPELPDLGGAGARLPGDGGVQLAPDTDGVDGMYVAAFRRL